LASAIHLGEPAERGTAALLAWRFRTPPSVAEERLSLALAILLLAVRSENVSDHRGEWLLQLTAWLEDEEKLARNQTREYMTLERATNSLWFMVETSWPTVIRQILLSQERPHPPEADEILRTLGMLLTTA